MTCADYLSQITEYIFIFFLSLAHFPEVAGVLDSSRLALGMGQQVCRGDNERMSNGQMTDTLAIRRQQSWPHRLRAIALMSAPVRTGARPLHLGQRDLFPQNGATLDVPTYTRFPPCISPCGCRARRTSPRPCTQQRFAINIIVSTSRLRNQHRSVASVRAAGHRHQLTTLLSH